MNTFDLIAELELTVDGYELEPLSAQINPELTRHCTLVQLTGAGMSGVGEDVVYEQAAHDALRSASSAQISGGPAGQNYRVRDQIRDQVGAAASVGHLIEIHGIAFPLSNEVRYLPCGSRCRIC
jgi:hypothetical protein